MCKRGVDRGGAGGGQRDSQREIARERINRLTFYVFIKKEEEEGAKYTSSPFYRDFKTHPSLFGPCDLLKHSCFC